MSAGQNRRYRVPGLEIVLVRAAAGSLPGDVPLNHSRLYFASPARLLLENLQDVRADKTKVVGAERVQAHLAALLLARGADALNALRDQAREISLRLHASKSWAKLDGMMGALLGTRAYKLENRLAQSIVNAAPYDPVRLDRFEKMVDVCLAHRDDYLTHTPEPTRTLAAQEVFAFFESYFSNFIEGTRFPLDEAIRIVTSQTPLPSRPKDSHDILGVYRLAQDPLVRAVPLPKTRAFATTLAARHQVMMAGRPEAEPGQFKQLRNMAGNTVFVEPALVRGTLNEAAALFERLPAGFTRAVFMMAVITEVHPFADGNGRLARLCMNTELSAVGESRILVPILARDEYLDCLRCFSLQNDAVPLLQYMRRLQRWSAGFSYDSFLETEQTM